MSQRCHQSAYGAEGPITAAQKAVEMIFERIARHEGAGLTPRFWLDARWKKAYVRQVLAANRLLKLYDPEAVFRAIGASPGARSLTPGFFADLVRDEQDRIDGSIKRAEVAAPIETHDTSVAPRQGVRRVDSVKSKLKGL